MKEKSTERIIFIDWIRAFAILCVLLCHATEGIYRLEPNAVNRLSLQSKLFAFTGFSMGRLGVPLFLFISGFLLLDRKYDAKQTKDFIFRKCMNLLVTFEIWVVLYNIFLIAKGGATFSLNRLIREMLLVRKTDISHIWYMPMILGMYLCIPAAANMLRNTSMMGIVLPVCILGAYAFVVPVINVLFSVAGIQNAAVQLDMSFTGGVYGIYLIAGYLCKKNVLSRMGTKLINVISVVSFGIVVWLQIYAHGHGYRYNVWYSNIFLLVCALGVFELAARADWLRENRFCTSLSKYAFAIYLIHNPIRIVMQSHMRWTNVFPIRVIALFSVSLLGSWLLAALISRIPKVSKWVLFMK